LQDEKEKRMSCEPKQEPEYQAELNVNGESIELNSFVENIISQAIVGMVKPLRGIGDVETITLKISRRAR